MITEPLLLACAIGPQPKPKTYLDPRAMKSSVADMARELARRQKEVSLFSSSFLKKYELRLCAYDASIHGVLKRFLWTTFVFI